MQAEHDDYNLRVMIERMQQEGRPEREIEAAVHSASRRLARQRVRPALRPGTLGPLGRLGRLGRLLPSR